MLLADLGFALLVFPFAAGLILRYPAWQIVTWGVFLFGSRGYLRWGARLTKGRLLLPWIFASSALGFLGVLGGRTVPPVVIAGTLSLFILLVLRITRQSYKRGSPLARKWLEITTYLSLFLGVSFLFGLTYVYTLWWGVVLVALGLFALPVLRMLLSVKGHKVEEPFLFVGALLLMEISFGYVLLPVSHTILAAALIVFVALSVSLYQMCVSEGWSWKKGGIQIGLFLLLEGSLLAAGL